MLISILIPVYNVDKYLPQCLQSIETQSFQDYEVVIVDDGSTDSSGQLCDEYQNDHPQRVRVIHQENQGLLGARITAIRAAAGKYCLCLDSDDYWESDCLERLNRILVEKHNPDIVLFNYSTLSDETGLYSVNEPAFCKETIIENDKSALYEKLVSSTSLNAIWIKLIRTDLMKASVKEYAGFSYRIAGEDVVQSLYPVTYAKKIVYSPLPLYVYRVRSTSLAASATDANLIRRSDLPMREFLRKYMDIWGYNDPVCVEKYHCMNMLLMANLVYGVLRKTADYKKTAVSLKKLDFSYFINKEAYRYRHSKRLSVKNRIRVNLLLKRRMLIIKIILELFKKRK